MEIQAQQIKAARLALGEDQKEFGARFQKSRRTVIRWEQRGTRFSTWRRFEDGTSELSRWRLVAEATDRPVVVEWTSTDSRTYCHWLGERDAADLCAELVGAPGVWTVRLYDDTPAGYPF